MKTLRQKEEIALIEQFLLLSRRFQSCVLLMHQNTSIGGKRLIPQSNLTYAISNPVESHNLAGENKWLLHQSQIDTCIEENAVMVNLLLDTKWLLNS